MATNDKKKEQVQPAVYGGAYDNQINDLANQINNRPDFNYNVNGDALYQQYKDRYVQNARRSMKDTMGQAAGLTGGYGSTYAQGVGQQAYDETMRGLTDKIPELEDRAFQRYKEQGDQIMTQFNIANQLGAADQATRQRDQEWDFTQRQYADQQSQYQDKQRQQAYENLSSAILTSGYQPTNDELTASGMTKEQADALRQSWIVSNPGQAWMLGLLTADQYLRLTGQVAPGSVAPATGGGGGGGYSGQSNEIAQMQQHLQGLGFDVKVTGKKDQATEKAAAQYNANNKKQEASLAKAGYSPQMINYIMNSTTW